MDPAVLECIEELFEYLATYSLLVSIPCGIEHLLDAPLELYFIHSGGWPWQELGKCFNRYGVNMPIFRLLLKDAARDCENIEELLRALWVASYNGIQEMVKELLEKLPDAILEERGGYSIALFAAASQGHGTIVTLLLSRGIDSKTPSKCLCEQIPVGFRYRSDTCTKNTHGTAMEAASIGGHIEIVKLLLPTHPDHSDFYRALSHASRNGHIEIVKLLMPPVFKREEFSCVLQAASRNGHAQIVELLHQTGINSDETLGLCCSDALLDAAERGF